MDEGNREGLQSGLLRPDGSRKASYDAVKTAIARAQTGCAGRTARWAPENGVVGAEVAFAGLRARLAAEEEITFTAGIFRAGSSRSRIARSLASAGRSTAVGTARGRARAYYKVQVRPPRVFLTEGRYVYAIKVTAAMNPARTSVFLSPGFQIR
jgi:hypothetical protein